MSDARLVTTAAYRVVAVACAGCGGMFPPEQTERGRDGERRCANCHRRRERTLTAQRERMKRYRFRRAGVRL